jgi:hypothetical protein
MDRTAATAYLTDQYRELSTDAKFDTGQTTSAYDTVIDMSLRYLGVQEEDLSAAVVAQADITKYIALLNYFALKRFLRVLAIRFDVSVGKGALNAQRSQAYQAVSALLKDAEEELLKLGIDLGGGPSFQMGRINLDFNEPGWRGEEWGYGDFFGW